MCLLYEDLSAVLCAFVAGLANSISQRGHIICKDLPKGHTCVYIYHKWWV